MDKSIEALAKSSINDAVVIAGTISANSKSEWQIAIEQRLDSLSTANDALSAQVVQLQDEVRRIRG